MSIVKQAVIDYKQIKEEATKNAEKRLAKKMSSDFEKLLKEEIEKRMLNETMIEQQPDSIVADADDSSMAMDTEDIPQQGGEIDFSGGVAENCDMKENEESFGEDDIDLKELKEAMDELNIDDLELNNEEGSIDEHDLNFEIDFDDEGLTLSDITIDGDEMEDIEIDLDELSGSEDDEEEIDLDIEGGSDEEEIEFSDDEVDLEVSDDEVDLDVSDDAESDEIELDVSSEENPDIDIEVSDEDDTLEEDEFEDDDISLDDLDDFDEDEVEEGLAHTMTYDNSRQAGSHHNANSIKKNRLRPAMRENVELKKKVNKLMKENKELVGINEGFKAATKKYKDQLYEMIFHNANLSHVNNLFVEHTTTIDEKNDILAKFNNVQTLEESKKLYKSMKQTLNESKTNKKTLEEVVSNSTINEEATITESVSYEKNDAVSKVLDLMKRMER